METLTSQVALALESAALTEDLLRRESQARFASLVRHSSDLVMVIEPDTTISYASPSAERLLGVNPDDLVGTRLADLIPVEDQARVLAFLTPTIDEEEGRTGLTEFRLHAPRRRHPARGDPADEPPARPQRPRHRPQHA